MLLHALVNNDILLKIKRFKVELRYSNQLNRTKLCLDVILTLFLKSAEIPLLSKRLVLKFLVSREHTKGLWYPHIL